MPVLNIQGKRVNIGDNFLNLSPEEQNKTVEEIASQMNIEAAPTEQTQEEQRVVGADTSQPFTTDNMPSREQFMGTIHSMSALKDGKPDRAAPQGNPVDEQGQITPDFLKQITDDKGDITTNVWDGVDYKTALDAYNGLANSPSVSKARGATGSEELVYKGHVIPFPQPGLFKEKVPYLNKIPIVGEMFEGGSSPGRTQIMQRGIAEGAANIGQKLLSVVDTITQNVPVVPDTNLSPALEFPEMKSGDMGDALFHDLAPVVIGAGAGLKAANAGAEALGLGRIGTGAARVAGTELGSTAAIDEDTSGIISGEESLIPKNSVTDSIQLDTDGKSMSQGESTLAKWVNQSIDSALAGGALSMAGKAIGWTGKKFSDIYPKDIGPVVSKNKQLANVNRDMLRDLGLPEGASNAERSDFAGRVKDYMQTGQDSFKELKVDLDPIAAIKEGARIKGDKDVATRAEILRNDIYGANLAETRQKQDQYLKDIIPGYKEDIYQKGGGEAGVETARKGIVDSSEADRQAFRNPLDQTTKDLETGEQGFKDMILNDPQFGSQIDDLSKRTKINIREGVNATEDQITTNVRKAEQKLSGNKEVAVSKLPSSVKVDRKEFDGLVYQADEETGELVFRPWLSTAERKIIENANGSFKKLYGQLAPALSKRIQTMKNSKNADHDILEQMIALKDNITDRQPDLLAARGAKPETLQLIENVKSSFRDYYSFFGQGNLAKVRKANKSTIEFKNGEVNIGRENQSQMESRKAVIGMTGNENREVTQDLAKLLSTHAGNQSQNDLVDLYIGRALLPLREKIQKGEVSGLEVEDFVKGLSNDAASLQRDFPDAYNKAQKFIDDLKSGRNQINTLKENLTKAQSAYDNADSVLKEEMKPFYDSSGVANTNGQSAFEKVFNTGKNSLSQVKQLINRAKSTGDDSVLSGIKGAFGQKLKSVTPKQFSDNQSEYMGVARELFKDDPDVLTGIEEAYRLANITEVGQGTRIGALAGAASTQQKALQAVNKTITLFFGVLNPTATRIRTIATTLAQENSPKEGMTKLIGEVASNPEQFKEMLTKFNPEDIFNGRNKELIYEFGARAGMWDAFGDSRRGFDEKWNSLQQNTMNEDARSKSQRDTDRALR